MRFLLDQFMDYLTLERGLSPHTRLGYGHDLSEFLAFLARKGRSGIQETQRRDIVDFLLRNLRVDGYYLHLELLRNHGQGVFGQRGVVFLDVVGRHLHVLGEV